MSVATQAPPDARAARRAKLSLLSGFALSTWGRAVVVIVGASVTAHLVGLDEASGFAVLPGIYMALGPPVGRVGQRVVSVLVATFGVAAMVLLGAAVSGSTVAIAIGLLVVGFAVGLLPRAGPRWAAMQLPLLTGLAYSASFPLSDASAASRVGAVLVAAPVYLVGVAILFQTNARRPLLAGATAALNGIAAALAHVLAGAADAARAAELGLIKFRVATGRMKEAALPYDESLDSRAARLLTVSVQQAVTATELLDGGAAAVAGARRERIGALAGAVRGLAAAVSGSAPAPEPGRLDELATAARADDDSAGALLADALADAARASNVLRGESDRLPSGRLAELPGALTRLRGAVSPDDPIFRRAVRLAVAMSLAGLIASLLDLSRIYWAVFAAVVVLNAPAALDRKRGLMRIGGTAAGFLVAVGLVALVGDNGTLAFALGLLALLVALFLIPINYGAGVVFITTAVSMLYATSGEEADFLRFRVVDNGVGVAVVIGVGLLLWRTGRADWWRAARLTAGSLADAAAAAQPTEHRDMLVTRAVQLRTETVEAAAIPDTTSAFAASWTYVGAAEDLIRALIGPASEPTPADLRAELASRLRAVEVQCSPDGRQSAAAPPAAARETTRAGLDVARMASAVAVLRRQA